MAMHLKDNSDDTPELSEINVTPFIDVMLVLLIIFMIAAPLATVDIKVDLPASSAQPQPRPEKPLIVSLKADNSLYVDNQLIANPDQLVVELNKFSHDNKDTTIFFQADKTVNYEAIFKIINELRQAGYLKIGLVGLEAVPSNE